MKAAGFLLVAFLLATQGCDGRNVSDPGSLRMVGGEIVEITSIETR